MSQKIFVVEDDALTATQLQQYIGEMGFEFAGAADSAEAALEQIRQTRADLVLMDIRLNGAMDGIDAAAKLQADGSVAVIYLTAYADDDMLARAKLTEPFGYLLKPLSRQELGASIAIGMYKSEMERRQQRIFDAVVQVVTELVKLHDPFLNGVQTRAAELAAAIATELHLNGQEVKGIRLAAMLHGVGLVAMPADLLNRREPLQGVEDAYIRTHPEIAWRLLKGIEFPFPVAEMVYQHMERLDGSGFPRRLSGAAILPGARVVAVACRVAKLLTPRGIEAAASVEQTLTELEAGSGILFDPQAVKACVRLFRDKGFAFRA